MKPASSATPPEPARSNAGRAAHFVLQGKGGVGKSYIASLIAQYLSDNGRLQGCFDTDPVNGSLQSVTALRAEAVNLLSNSAVNVKGVDRLIEAIINAEKEIVVDNGAASFLPLSSYLLENDIGAVLKEHGVRMVVHTVVTGGSNGIDTLKGLEAIIEHFAADAQIVVWVNEFFGPARFRGTDFEQTAVFTSNQAKVHGIVYLRELDKNLFAPNLAELLERKLTFAEAATSPDFMLMEKSRLHRIKTGIWEQLGSVV